MGTPPGISSLSPVIGGLMPVPRVACIVDARLFQEVLELPGAGGVTELPQGLGLYLADTLPGDAELPADLFQGTATAVLQAKPQLENSALPEVESIQDVFY